MYINEKNYNRELFIKAFKKKYGKKDEYQYDFDDYAFLVKKLGKIVCEAHQDGYHGDSVYYVVAGPTRFGFLTFGWGSCSGCDALEACITPEDYADLFEDLLRDIVWFTSLKKLRTYLKNKDWEGTYIDEELIREFLKKMEVK